MLRSRKLRQICPRTLSDIAACLFFVVIVPAIYLFEIREVLPNLYNEDPLWWNFHIAVGTYIFLNIWISFAFVVFVDTSTRVHKSPQTVLENWHVCAVCCEVVPPRAWHCQTCRVCILKRDHHCSFSGCCIGHFNHRYFIALLVYIWLGTLYATYFNVFHVISIIDLKNVMTFMRLVFPMIIMIMGMDVSVEQIGLMLFSISIVVFLLLSTLLYYHVSLVLNGFTTNEKSRNIRKYNYGWRWNWRVVMGDRWYLTLICPLLAPPMHHDGVSWQ